jgi:hypothetical protein
MIKGITLDEWIASAYNVIKVCKEENSFNTKKQTNGDKIRSMSDEELAEHFSKLIKDTHEYEYCEDVKDWLKWLQEEVKK